MHSRESLTDKASKTVMPDSMKSGSQKAGDKSSSMYEQTKNAVSNTFSSDNSKCMRLKVQKGMNEAGC